MFHLDLKELLLTSLSAEKTLHLHKRFTIGSKCFTVIFDIRGKHLFIKKVKISEKENIHSKHIRQRLFSMNIRQKAISYAKKVVRCSRKRAVKLYDGSKSIDKETMTLAESRTGAGDCNAVYSNIGMIDVGFQITPKAFDFSSDCRDINYPVDKEQQTCTVEYLTVSTQTHSSLLSVGIQASSPMLSFSTQTLRCTEFASTQTNPDDDVCCSGTETSNFDVPSGEVGDAFKALLLAISHNQCNQTINLQNCHKILEQLHVLIEMKSDEQKKEVTKQNEIIKKLIAEAFYKFSKRYKRRSDRIHKYCKLIKSVKTSQSLKQNEKGAADT